MIKPLRANVTKEIEGPAIRTRAAPFPDPVCRGYARMPQSGTVVENGTIR